MTEQAPQGQPVEGIPQAEQEQQHYKTLAVRVEESLHAQLRFIAQLSDSSIAEEIRRAIEARVATAQDDPDLQARAEQVRGEIEREAAARRDAIAGFFGKTAVEATTTSGRASRRGSKTSNE
jgi:hypothetical protein